MEKEKTILLIENQSGVSFAMVDALKTKGYVVFTAKNAIEATSFAKRNKLLSLILINADLGNGADGIEAAKTILQNQNIPIVFIINQIEKNIIEKLEKVSTYGYVLKDAGETAINSSVQMALKLFEADQKLKAELDKNKLLEVSLIESEEKFRKIAEDTNAFLMTVSKRGRIIYVNDGAERNLGYPKEKLINSFYLKLIHPEDRQKINDIFLKQTKGLIKNSVTEYRYIRKDRTTGWVRFLSNQIYKDGEIIAINGVGQDITLSKQIEEELHKKEAHYRSIVENLNLIYYEANVKTALTYCNLGFITMSGYSEKEILGKTVFRFIAEEHRADIIDRYQKAFKEKQINLVTEFKAKPKNGKEFWVKQVTHFDYDEQGNFIIANNILRNIDERKKAEETLQRSEETLRQFFNNSSDAIFLIDQGKFIDANEVALQLYGYTHNEFLNMTPQDLAPLRLKGTVSAYVSNAVKVKQDFEWVHVKKNGNEFPIEIHTKPMTINSKPCIFAEVRDITERKKIEEALKKSEADYRRFFEEDLSGIYLSTPNDGIKSCNPAYINILEYDSVEDLIKSNPVNHYRQSQERIDFLNLLRKEKRVVNREAELVTKTGKVIQIIENVFGVFDENDNLIEFFGLCKRYH